MKENVFDEIVEASGKVPRSFIELFKAIVQEFNFDINKKWDRNTTIQTIIRKSINVKGDIEGDEGSLLEIFFESALKIAIKHKSRVFLIKKSERLLLNEAISDLFHHELIHSVNSEMLPINILDKYEAYYLDYGYFLKACEKKISNFEYSKFKCPLNEETTQEEIDNLTIYAANVTVNSTICKKCDAKISLDHLAVVKQNACPNCFETLHI